MALKHDTQGFLTGDPMDLGRQMLNVLGDIRTDVQAIRKAVQIARPSGSVGRRSTTLAQSIRPERAAAIPQAPLRRADGLKPAVARDGGASGGIAHEAAIAAIRASKEIVKVNRERDKDGRFKKKDGAEEKKEEEKKQSGSSFVSRVAGRVANTVSASADGIQEADPMARAVGEIVGPLAKGYRMLAGDGERKSERGLLRRIFGVLTAFRKEETTYSKTANKTLKKIEGKPGAEGGGEGGGGGILGMLAGLLGGIPILGPLLSGGGKFFKGLMGAGKGLFGAGKGLFKKIPIIGPLISGALAAFDIFDSENDPKLSRRDKDKRAGKAYGGFSGGLGGMAAGAAIGTAIFPGVGTAIGGAIGAVLGSVWGEYIGEKIGGWVNDLRAFDIPGKIVGAWDTVTGAILKGWTALSDSIKRGWEVITGPIRAAHEAAVEKTSKAIETTVKNATAANDFIKRNTGVDVFSAAKSQVDAAMKAGGAVLDAGQGFGKKVRKSVAAGWGDAKDYLLPAAKAAGMDPSMLVKTAHGESGFNANAAPVARDKRRNRVRQFDGRMAMSSAHGYGQFTDDTWTGAINKYGAKYGIEGAGNLSKAEAAKYRTDKKIQASMLAEFTKDNIEKGRKYGGPDDDANVYAFHNLGDTDAIKILNALKKDPTMSVRDALLAGSDSDKARKHVASVISGNSSLYKNGKISVADAYRNFGKFMRRGEPFAVEARVSTGLASIRAAQVPPVEISSSLPRAPSVALPPPIPDAPPIETPLGSGSRQGPVSVTLPPSDPGQDVRDRGIAHIVTGGLSK